MKFLERLLDPDQLIVYPSKYPAFNEAYEDALECLWRHPKLEFYVVQYRGGGGTLYFSWVPAALVDADGSAPFGLKDICGVLRR
jgi:hypothetical protein